MAKVLSGFIKARGTFRDASGIVTSPAARSPSAPSFQTCRHCKPGSKPPAHDLYPRAPSPWSSFYPAIHLSIYELRLLQMLRVVANEAVDLQTFHKQVHKRAHAVLVLLGGSCTRLWRRLPLVEGKEDQVSISPQLQIDTVWSYDVACPIVPKFFIIVSAVPNCSPPTLS